MPCCESRNATEKMPAEGEAATGASAMAHVTPPSAVRGITHDEAAVGVPEGHRVEERFGVLVRELQHPVRARVGRLVDPRCGSRADAHLIGGRFADGVDVTKIKRFPVRDRDLPPRRAPLAGAETRAPRAPRPPHPLADRAHTPR